MGTFSTPFTTATSAYFVWYQLFGVGTLAYCFAVMAEIARKVMDNAQKKKQRHQHSSGKPTTTSITATGAPLSQHSASAEAVEQSAIGWGRSTAVISLSGGGGADVGKVTVDCKGEARALFLSHAEALDRLVLELLLSRVRSPAMGDGAGGRQ